MDDSTTNDKMNNEKTYWRKWYLGVLSFLVLQILVYYLITIYFK
jgi:hypothetical protein